MAKSPSSRRALTRDTVLRCAHHFSLRWKDGGFTAEIEGRKFWLGSDGPALLQAFARPCSLASALEPLQAGVEGGRHWMELTNLVVGMWEAGLLVEEEASVPTVHLDSSGYGAARIHIRMLNDKARTAAFLDAIRKVVRPGDVVADLGTGTGVLAIGAAQAGARRVYAVEASGIGRLAEKMFRANGVEDRIVLLAGWSARLQLPELADVLVTEMIGDDPLGEQALELVLDARKRWLKPGARLIPSRLRILALPVTVSEEQIRRHCFVPEVLANWSSWYGLSFEPLAQAAPGPASMTRVLLKLQEAQACRPLGDPVLL
ncbi:MAG: 50S ribosomal protein L11 methyltransferase, partial [Terriglobales bacterium]